MIEPRRRLLCGLGAAAALTLPAIPDAALGNIPKFSEISSPDAELLALGREWAASAEREDKLSEVLFELRSRYDSIEPNVPEALFRGPEDHIHFHAFRMPHTEWRTDRCWYSPGTIERLQQLKLTRMNGHVKDDRLVVTAQPNLPARARRDEILAARDAYETECQALKDACGLTAAEAVVDAEIAVNRALRRRIIEMQAMTLDGVLLKARVVAWCCQGLGEIEQVLADQTEASDTVMELSIIRDLVAMLPPTATVA